MKKVNAEQLAGCIELLGILRSEINRASYQEHNNDASRIDAIMDGLKNVYINEGNYPLLHCSKCSKRITEKDIPADCIQNHCQTCCDR